MVRLSTTWGSIGQASSFGEKEDFLSAVSGAKFGEIFPAGSGLAPLLGPF